MNKKIKIYIADHREVVGSANLFEKHLNFKH